MAYLHHEFIVIWWAELLSAALQLSFHRFGPLQFFVGTTSLAEFVDVAHHWQGYGWREEVSDDLRRIGGVRSAVVRHRRPSRFTV